MRMNGKVALVTGAGSGLVRATALRFAAEGAKLACVDVAEDAAAQTAQGIEAQGGAAIALRADVTDEAACARMVQDTLARFGAAKHLIALGLKAPRLQYRDREG